MPLLVITALAAGILTTISGFGGGVLLLLAVTVVEGPRTALVATSIGLFAANAHRIWLYRADIRRAVTVPVLIGIVPGALAGALLASAIPELAVHAIMLAVVALSIAKAWFGWGWRPRGTALVSSSLAIGLLAGSAGGAGFLIGPLILATGLVGRRYLATIAVGSVAMHLARIVGYTAGGLVTHHVLAIAALLAPALLVGNLIGNQLRVAVPAAWQRRIELGAPVVCVALALGGLA